MLMFLVSIRQQQQQQKKFYFEIKSRKTKGSVHVFGSSLVTYMVRSFVQKYPCFLIKSAIRVLGGHVSFDSGLNFSSLADSILSFSLRAGLFKIAQSSVISVTDSCFSFILRSSFKNDTQQTSFYLWGYDFTSQHQKRVFNSFSHLRVPMKKKKNCFDCDCAKYLIYFLNFAAKKKKIMKKTKIFI